MNTLYYITSEMMSMYEAEAQPAPADQPTQPVPADQPPQPAPVPVPADQPPQPALEPVDVKYDPIKKYILYNKILELKQYMNMYLANSRSADVEGLHQLLKYISIVIDFYDMFDYPAVLALVKDITIRSKSLIKTNRTSKELPK